MTAGALVLPRPLLHQVSVLDHPANRKVWRAARRVGKSRAAFLAGVDGHGPRDAMGRPLLKGLLQGGDILWLAPDFPQSNAIWREEVLPRFDGVHGAEVHISERRVSLRGLGTLELRSAEAIDSVRGRAFDGVIVDEAAWLDLEYALQAVLLAALIDRDGWLFLISSPNGGHDGNSAKRVPSYFNLLCEEIQAGKRPGWVEFVNRTEDNRTLSREVIATLRAEYPPGSLTAQQELDAELVAGGGRFYPEVLNPPPGFWVTVPRKGLHWEGPTWATHWGAFDWGYTHPFAFASFRRVGNTVTWLDTLYGHKMQDEEMAALIRGTVDPRCLAEVYAGHDAFAKRMAHSAAAETVADVFDRYGIALGRANLDKAAGAKALRRLFARLPMARVTLEVNDTPGNRRAVDEFSKLIPDHLNLDVPAKRDANERGENGDDGADAARYGLVNVGSETFEPIARTEPGNVATGRDPDARSWNPEEPLDGPPWVEPLWNRSRSRGGVVVQYEERPSGADGQFGF